MQSVTKTGMQRCRPIQSTGNPPKIAKYGFSDTSLHGYGGFDSFVIKETTVKRRVIELSSTGFGQG